MSLRGQDSPSPRRGFGGTSGYAMAALLVSLAVMAVLMSVALPVWRHEAQREKEEELVWRGQQYMRAIRLFQMKTQALPTSADLLVQGHYLRKKFKDPITNDDFEYMGAGGAPGQPSAPGQQGNRGATPGGASSKNPPASSQPSSSSALNSGTVPGGMIGVRSKSKDESIRMYLGRNHYNEWAFLFVQNQPGGPGGRGQPGGPGGRGQRGTGPNGDATSNGRPTGTNPFGTSPFGGSPGSQPGRQPGQPGGTRGSPGGQPPGGGGPVSPFPPGRRGGGGL
jgi:type II secretory pathway pseudopilin PulG